MDPNYVSEPLCKERQKTTDEHFKRVDERLKIGEGKIDTVEKAVVLLTEMSKHTQEAVSDHDKRIESLEHRPIVIWDKVIFGIISAVVSGGVAILFNIFS